MSEKLRSYRVWKIWDETVGPLIAQHAQPVRLRGTTLEIRVDQAVWMQQLQLLKPMLLGKLRQKSGGADISELFLRLGTLAPTEQPSPPTTPPPPKRPLTPSEQETIKRGVSPLADNEVRHALQDLWSRHQQSRINDDHES